MRLLVLKCSYATAFRDRANVNQSITQTISVALDKVVAIGWTGGKRVEFVDLRVTHERLTMGMGHEVMNGGRIRGSLFVRDSEENGLESNYLSTQELIDFSRGCLSASDGPSCLPSVMVCHGHTSPRQVEPCCNVIRS